jgi:hypothetical protein
VSLREAAPLDYSECFFLKLTLIMMLMTAMPAKKTMSASMR